MRIDAYNSINQIYKVNTVKKTNKSSATAPTDSFTISQEAKDYQTARAAVKDAPDVRADLVADIKSRMEAGTYDVSSSDFADKLLAKFMGE